jgi:hypothetical protein
MERSQDNQLEKSAETVATLDYAPNYSRPSKKAQIIIVGSILTATAIGLAYTIYDYIESERAAVSIMGGR